MIEGTKNERKGDLLIPRIYIPVCENHLCFWVRIDQFPGKYRSWEISHGLYSISHLLT